MNDVARGSGLDTYRYLMDKLGGIQLERFGKTVVVHYQGKTFRLPPYPEIKSVRILREGDVPVPQVPRDWVVQWKANGSNIRVIVVGGEIVAVTRGGFLVDWSVYRVFIDSGVSRAIRNALTYT